MQYYALYILHADESDIAGYIRDEISSQLKSFQCDPSILEIIENPADLISDKLSQKVSIGIYIGSQIGKNAKHCNEKINTLIAAKIPVIPILKESDKFENIAPKSLVPINAFHWEDINSCPNIVSAMLRLLGLTEKHRRVFISYPRKDASTVGEQLWEFLSKKGFEVFFDRFGIEPGLRFQEKLTESLCDKAFLLLLEAPSAHNSKWIEYEVDFARIHNMGLLVLTWPETKEKVPNIPDEQRVYLKEDYFDKRTGAFNDDYLKILIGNIERIHAEAMLSRRRLLMDSLQKELDRYSIPYVLLSNWSLVADTRKVFSGDHLISITPRPPDVPDLFLLHKNCSAYHLPLEMGVLIHTVSRSAEERHELLKWVISEKKLKLFDQGQLVEMVIELSTGKI
jgi:hypothetical protein